MVQKTDVLLDPNDYANMPKFMLEQLVINGDKKAEEIYFKRYGNE